MSDHFYGYAFAVYTVAMAFILNLWIDRQKKDASQLKHEVSELKKEIMDLQFALTQWTRWGEQLRLAVDVRFDIVEASLNSMESRLTGNDAVDEVISASDLIAQASESRAPSVEPRPTRVLRGNGT